MLIKRKTQDHRNAALTGCDTTFYFHGISKKSAYKVYRNNYLEAINWQKSKRISEVSLLYVYQRETVQRHCYVCLFFLILNQNFPEYARTFVCNYKTNTQPDTVKETVKCMYAHIHLLPCPTKMWWKKMSMGQFFDSASYFFHEETWEKKLLWNLVVRYIK